MLPKHMKAYRAILHEGKLLTSEELEFDEGEELIIVKKNDLCKILTNGPEVNWFCEDISLNSEEGADTFWGTFPDSISFEEIDSQGASIDRTYWAEKKIWRYKNRDIVIFRYEQMPVILDQEMEMDQRRRDHEAGEHYKDSESSD